MKIALVGYGKMGKMIESIALSRGHEIVSKIDIHNPQDFDSAAFRHADVAIEFTSPHVAADNVGRCFDAGVKVVSGSTGWLKGEVLAEMKQRCEEEGRTLLWSSNFSVGVAVFRAVNRYLARLMNRYPQYSAGMSETHHVHKIDAPSGTAITLAEQAIEELERYDGWQLYEKGAEIAAGKLPIAAYREGEVPGIHTMTYNSPADEIVITHSAHNREGFALGAVLAAEYLDTHSGWLTIDDLFKF